jgi:cytidyltransferase-like protein
MSNKIENIELYPFKQNIKHLAGKTIVLVGGCFDILHFGHIQFLQKAKNAGDYLIVALEPDERIIKDKLRLAVHTQEKRAHNLLSLRSVDKIILLPLLNGFEDYSTLVQAIKPNIIAVTHDDPQLSNKKKHALIVEAQCITVIKRVEPFSSSDIYLKNI